MRDISAFSIAVIALLIFALLAPNGCSREHPKAVVINPPQQIEASSNSGINIPAPGIILRNAAALSQTRYHDGADFNQSLPYVNVAAQDSAGLFTPNWQSGDPSENLAYAIYSFNVLDYIGAAELHYAFDSDDNWSNIWLGLPDIAADVWRWQNLDGSSPLDLVEFTNKADEFGNLIVAVVLTGNTPTQLEWVRIGDDILPEAVLAADQTNGSEPLAVNFDASGSQDAEGPLVLFEWDWDGDGTYEEDSGTMPTNQHVYTGTGDFNATVRVTDNADNQVTASVSIFVIGGDPSWHTTLIADVRNNNHTVMDLFGKPAVVYVTGMDPSQITFRRSLDAFGAQWADPVNIGTGWLQEGELLVVDGKPAFAFIKQGDGFISTVSFISAQDALGSAWNTPIDLATDVGNPYMSAAVIDGNPALCYSAPNDEDALYFTRATDPAGATWAAPVLVTTSVYQAYSILSMAEVNGNPAIVFFDDDEYLGFVRATSADGSTWGTAQTGLTSEWLGFGLTLAVVNGNPAICYADDGEANMYMASTDVNGNAWGAPVIVPSPGEIWNECGLAVVNGIPAISFTDSFPPRIYYCDSDDGNGDSWTTYEPVSSAEDVDWESKLIDLNGLPAMTFYTDVQGEIEDQIFFASYY